jgi:hypothetical protein
LPQPAAGVVGVGAFASMARGVGVAGGAVAEAVAGTLAGVWSDVAVGNSYGGSAVSVGSPEGVGSSADERLHASKNDRKINAANIGTRFRSWLQAPREAKGIDRLH